MGNPNLKNNGKNDMYIKGRNSRKGEGKRMQ
jgi:hypothetical protein